VGAIIFFFLTEWPLFPLTHSVTLKGVARHKFILQIKFRLLSVHKYIPELSTREAETIRIRSVQQSHNKPL